MSEQYEVSISRDAATVTRASFSNALILGSSDRFPERYRVFSLDGVIPLGGLTAAGFLATDPEYLAAAAYVASDTRPNKVIIGRALRRPTQRWKVTPYVVGNATTYSLQVGFDVEDVATFTSDATATPAEICTGLAAAVTALNVEGITADASSGTSVLITADEPGTFIPVQVLNRDLLTLEQNNDDPGVAADLTELLLAVQSANGTADWYVVILCHASTATVMAAAAWAEVNKRMLLFTTNDTRAVRPPVAGDLDVCSRLLALSYEYTACIWHHNAGAYTDAAWAGRCLPLDAGTETWFGKKLGGIEPSALTGTERAQLQARRTSYYATDHGFPLTLGEPGAQMFSGEYIDNRRGIDTVAARLGEDYVAATADRDKKIGYDDPGFQKVAGIHESTLREFESTPDQPRLAKAGTISVTVPLEAKVPKPDRDARRIPVNFYFELANAAHKTVVRGVIK